MAKIETLFKLPSMGHYSSRKEWESACWQKISKSENLERLITSHERHNLVMRAAVIDSISSGKRFKQISEELHLSPQTVSSIKKSLKTNKYQSYRERGKTERKKKVYSSRSDSNKKRKTQGRPVRTKYGTVYLP